MSKNITKSLLTLVALLCLHAANALAGATLTMQDFKVIAGQTYTVAVAMSNDEAVDAISCTMTLPDGLTYVDGSFSQGSRVPAAYAAQYRPSTKRIAINSQSSSSIAAGNGTLFTFKVKAGTLTGDVSISLSGIDISNPAGYSVATATTASCKVSPVSDSFALEASPSSLDLQEGDEATVSLMLTCPEQEVGARMKISLPKGLSFVEGSEQKGAMLDPSHQIEVNKSASANDLTVVITATPNVAFASTYAELFSFKVKATGEVLAGSQIAISEIALSKLDGTETALDDVEIAVTADAAEYTLSVEQESIDLVGTDEAEVTLRATIPAEKVAAAMVITVPQNVEVVFDGDDAVVTKGDLLTSYHAVTINRRGATSYKVIVQGNDGERQPAFTSQEDVLFTFKVKATGEVAEGAEIAISDISFSDVAGEEKSAADVSVPVTYDAGVTLGDVNGDGEVNEVDAQLILDVSAGKITKESLKQPLAISVPGGNDNALEKNAQLVLDYSVASVKPW